jgi:NADPH:quinone reductase-like Zn-dependent oxidoreductase
MRAIEAKTFSGYAALRQAEYPKPQPAKDRVLVRVTAAGVTPLDYTVLSGGHPRAKAPLVLGNEGAGVIEDAGDSGLAMGSRVMFTGPYGVAENGAWQEWLLVRSEHLALVPQAIDDVVAAGIPVAYLTAQLTLALAGFKPGMRVLAPGIGGSVGNATYQLARAQGAGKVIFRRAQDHDRCDEPDLEARADGGLLPVRPITDPHRRRVAGYPPADRQRIRATDCGAGLSLQPGGRSPAPSDRGSAVW